MEETGGSKEKKKEGDPLRKTSSLATAWSKGLILLAAFIEELALMFQEESVPEKDQSLIPTGAGFTFHRRDPLRKR